MKWYLKELSDMNQGPDHKEIHALVRLLDENDPAILSAVEARLILAGRNALPILEEAASNNLNSLIIERISGILSRIRSEDVKNYLRIWVENGGDDLLKAYIAISRVEDPMLDEVQMALKVEQLRMDTWLELNDDLTALENIKVMNHVFFKHHHFTGNKNNPRVPSEQFLPQVLSSRKGNSLTLGILYLIVAQKLGIPLAGVNLPDHFILAYLAANGIKSPTPEDVLFYINPFKGSVFTRREIELFLRQLKVKASMEYFTPCPNLYVIERFLKTLILYYKEEKNEKKINDFEQLLNIIQS